MATITQAGVLAADNAQVLIDCGDCTAFSATVTGAMSGTITFQVLYDATEGWVSAQCFTRPKVSGTATLTAAGNRLVDTTSAVSLRALMHPYVSGSPEVTFAGMAAVSLAAGGGGGGGASTIADGADVAQGTTTDAGIITDVSGTVIGFLRGAIKMWITLLSRLPAALVGGRLDVNLGAAAATVTTQGGAAAGATASGNPLVAGSIDNSGNVRALQTAQPSSTTDRPYSLAVSGGLMQGSGQIYPAFAASGVLDANPATNIAASSAYVYNGATFDRLRNNVITNINTAAITATANSAIQTNYNNSGVILTLNITASSGTTPTLDIKVQVADGAGTFFDLTDSAGNAVAFAQKTGTGTDTLKIAPGIVEKLTAAGRQYNGQVPRSYRLAYTVGGTTPSFAARIDALELK